MTETELPDNTSLPEVVRRLDEVTRSVERLVRTMEDKYVRFDVYNARHDALRTSFDNQFRDARDNFSIRINGIESSLRNELVALREDLTEIKDARKAQIASNRQILGGLAVTIIGMLITAAVALSNFVARGGLG